MIRDLHKNQSHTTNNSLMMFRINPKKYRTLFTENDLKALKFELGDWLDAHPEESQSLEKIDEIKV